MKTESTLFTRREVAAGLAAAPFVGPLLRSARAAAAGESPQRLCFIYHGDGAHHDWTPAGSETAFTLTPHLAPLDRIKSDIIILKNLTMVGPAGLGHDIPVVGALTGWNPHTQGWTNCTPGSAGCQSRQPSFDQILATRWKGTAALDSLQIGFTQRSAIEGKGLRISFSNTDPVVALAPVEDPLAAYQKLMSKIAPTAPGASDMAGKLVTARRSVLDAVRKDIAALNARLGAKERGSLDGYFTSLRSLEENLAPSVQIPAASCTPPAAPPAGLGTSSYPQLIKAHLDVLAFAMSCGLTRVAVMQMTGGQLDMPMTWLGHTIGAHGISHYRIDQQGVSSAQKAAWMIQQQAWFVEQFVAFVETMKRGPQGLDGTVAIFAAQNGDSNAHTGANTPVVVAGNAGNRFKTGRLLDCRGRYQNDLLVAVAQAMGVLDMQKLGDPSLSQGPLPGLGG